MGYSPGFFPQNRPISDPREFTRNRQKQSPNELEIHFQAHRNGFRKFGTISRTFQNRPCLKPWAIAQAFCSKSVDFRPSRIHSKSTKTVPERVRNPFSTAQESFQEVWNDFQDFPKSAMFKTMGYSPGVLLKISRFPTLANSPEIDKNSPRTS